METPPCDSRQPPDGHEFPDFVEVSNEQEDDKMINNAVSQQLNVSEKSVKQTTETTHVNWSQNRSSFSDFSQMSTEDVPHLTKANSVSNSDLSSTNRRDPFDSGDEVILRRPKEETNLHTRSQSLIDMSTVSKQKNDRWNILAEQRKRSYSKLKGLVIPEHVSENEAAPVVNIPEIISHTATPLVVETKIQINEKSQHQTNETVTLSLTSPPWASNCSTLPKYSPAFKRKSLQVYNQAKPKTEEVPVAITSQPVKSATIKMKNEEEFRLDNLSDSPKSLESITSPTRSDCSFDYITNSLTKGKSTKLEPNKINNVSKILAKSEDESDNDSAVSSSQSSYISRCSPPPSPTRSCEMVDYESNGRSNKTENQDNNRLLKAASVEAINRKNILASAKCRSGRDFKVGSPVIQRKYDEENSLNGNKDVENGIAKPEVPKPEDGKNFTPPAFVKEKRSASCNEFKITRADDNSKSKHETSPRNLVTLRPVANSSLLPKSNLPKPSSVRNHNNNNKSMSVNDLRKSFEKIGTGPPPMPQKIPIPIKEPKIKTEVKSREKKISLSKEVPKLETVKPEVVTPLTQTGEETPQNNQRTIILCPEFVGGSIGITLAGGTDYETKEITVYKIRYGSVAYHDGRLKRGDKILSVNGRSTGNLTHAESVELLKEPVAEFALLVEDSKEQVPPSPDRKSSLPKVAEPKSERKISDASAQKPTTHVVTVVKNGAGLGFSIEGGKDSLEGDLPLRIKKIFQGGLADKSGELCVGDELLAINKVSLTNFSRMETWSLMKKLPDGEVNIEIHR